MQVIERACREVQRRPISFLPLQEKGPGFVLPVEGATLDMVSDDAGRSLVVGPKR